MTDSFTTIVRVHERSAETVPGNQAPRSVKSDPLTCVWEKALLQDSRRRMGRQT
jgi:hypothetical protein